MELQGVSMKYTLSQDSGYENRLVKQLVANGADIVMSTMGSSTLLFKKNK